MSEKSAGLGFVVGSMLGAAVGAVVGLLLAPRSGAESRAMAADAKRTDPLLSKRKKRRAAHCRLRLHCAGRGADALV